MNRVEAGKLLAVIQSRYPHANLGDPDAAATAWALTLDDVPYPAAVAVLGPWFKGERFAPDPSELRSRILAAAAGLPEAGDAWAMVLRHIRDNGEVGGRPFSGPEPVAQAVRAMGGWRVIRHSESPDKDRERFFATYPTYAKRWAAEADVAAAIEERSTGLPDGAPALRAVGE